MQGFGIDPVQDGRYCSWLLLVVTIHFIFLTRYTMMCRFFAILCRKLKIDYNISWWNFQVETQNFASKKIKKK